MPNHRCNRRKELRSLGFLDGIRNRIGDSVVGFLDLEKRQEGRWGLTPDYLSFRNTYFGQRQPVSYALLWKAYLEDPVVFACINTLADAIVGDGYKLVGGRRQHRKKLAKFLQKNEWNTVLRDTVTSLLIYGDSYMEAVRNQESGFIESMYTTDARTISVDYNEHGDPIKYIQRVLHRRVDFYTEEMIHFRLNVIGDRQYGHSSLQSILSTLQAKIYAETYNSDYFRRGGIPRMFYNVKNLSEEQVKRFVQKLQQLQYQQDVVLTGEVEAKSLAPTNQDIQFKELLHYYRENIIAALGVPPIFLGITEGGNRSNAQVMLEAFDRRVRALRSTIADKINNQLLTTENFGFEDVLFEFIDENNREELKDAQVASLLLPMVQAGIIMPDEIRIKLKLPPMSDIQEINGTAWGQNENLQPHPAANAPNPLKPADTDPRRSQERNDGRERQNVEQQIENKDSSDSFDYGDSYGESEQGEIIVKHGSKGKELIPRNFPRGRRYVPIEREHQGSITQRRTLETAYGVPVKTPIGWNVEGYNAAEGQYGGRRYPFGAVPIPQDREAIAEQIERLRSDKKRDIRETADNPISNAFGLNTERVFPRDKLVTGQSERERRSLVKPPVRSSREDVAAHPERDEVDQFGTPRWVAPDSRYSDVQVGSPFHTVRRSEMRYSSAKDVDAKKTLKKDNKKAPKKKWEFYEGTDQAKDENIEVPKYG